MKANPEKCHLLMKVNRSATIKIDQHIISKLLGVKIHSQLKFNNHLETIFKKAIQKVHISARITPFMCILNRNLLINTFFKV